MNRAEMLDRVKEREKIWDFIIIGGGATGAGCAVDAASRGFDVLLLEQDDFGKGTSSRSTKLVHGGVRYLAQGSVTLVREALKERAILLKNAPHLVRIQSFVVPVYSLREKFFYGAGLKIYNLLSGKYGAGKSRILSRKKTLEKLPNIQSADLKGGILYFDGQFDDARLLINLVRTAAENGAAVLNYARVFGFDKDRGVIRGVRFQDAESGEIFEAQARVVVNATGAFCDSVRKMSDGQAEKIIAPSQGIHLVFDRKFLPGGAALMIPKTSDGRVLFAVPWQDRTLIGTTDTPVEKADLEPQVFENEIDFILETAKDYLAKPPGREDILSVFAGIRPLVKSAKADNTARLSRDHTIEIDRANLLTITGGKWTTYRRMAEDAVDQAITIGDLPRKKCVTKNLKIYDPEAEKKSKLIEENPESAEKLHVDFPDTKAEIVWAVREEMARTLEDVLARRTRALFLDARAAVKIAPQIARIMAEELDKDKSWIDDQLEKFTKTAKNYLVSPD